MCGGAEMGANLTAVELGCATAFKEESPEATTTTVTATVATTSSTASQEMPPLETTPVLTTTSTESPFPETTPEGTDQPQPFWESSHFEPALHTRCCVQRAVLMTLRLIAVRQLKCGMNSAGSDGVVLQLNVTVLETGGCVNAIIAGEFHTCAIIVSKCLCPNSDFSVRRDAPIQPVLVLARPEWPPPGFDKSIV